MQCLAREFYTKLGTDRLLRPKGGRWISKVSKHLKKDPYV